MMTRYKQDNRNVYFINSLKLYFSQTSIQLDLITVIGKNTHKSEQSGLIKRLPYKVNQILILIQLIYLALQNCTQTHKQTIKLNDYLLSVLYNVKNKKNKQFILKFLIANFNFARKLIKFLLIPFFYLLNLYTFYRQHINTRTTTTRKYCIITFYLLHIFFFLYSLFSKRMFIKKIQIMELPNLKKSIYKKSYYWYFHNYIYTHTNSNALQELS